MISAWVPWASAISSRPSGGDDRAQRERHARAEAGAEHARERAGDEHHQRAGDHQQAGAGGVEPEAVAGRLRRLRELRDEDERAEHAEADEQVAKLVIATVGWRSISMSTSGSGVRRWSQTQKLRIDRADREQAERARVAPAPLVGLGDRQQRRGQPEAEHDRAADVDAAGRADGRLGHEQLDEDRRERRADRAEPEDPVVGGVVGDEAAEDQAGAAADAERGGDQADARADLLARELVADDPEAEREDAAAGALQDAAGDDDLEAGAERGDDRAGHEDAERDDEQAALAEHVAEAAEDRGADGGREQVGGDRPGDAAGVGVERLRELGERGDEHRLREREGERGEREDEERAEGVRARHRRQGSEADSRVRFGDPAAARPAESSRPPFRCPSGLALRRRVRQSPHSSARSRARA